MFRPVFRPNPAVWGLFSPLFAAHSPETPPFSPCRPAVFPVKPCRKPPFPRRSRPVFPVSTRHCAPSCRPKRARCAPFPGKPARFCPPAPRSFPLCARALPAIPPVLRPRPPRASQPPALGVRRRPELGSRWGFRPARLHRFAVVKRVPPQGGPNPWERLSGDRRPVAYKISQNSRLFSGLACGRVSGFQPIDVAPGCTKRKSPGKGLEVNISLP